VIKIPKYAKEKAQSALKLRDSLPKSKKFGLSKKEANSLGIASGVERAKQIVKQDYLDKEDAERVCAFKRFLKRDRTPKIQGAIDLWGGEKFINKVCLDLE
jgi:hypothetical protein